MNKIMQKNGILDTTNGGTGTAIVTGNNDDRNTTCWVIRSELLAGVDDNDERMERMPWSEDDRATPKQSCKIPQAMEESMSMIVASMDSANPGVVIDTNDIPKEPYIIADTHGSLNPKKLFELFQGKLPKWLIVPHHEGSNMDTVSDVTEADAPVQTSLMPAVRHAPKASIGDHADADAVTMLKATAFGYPEFKPEDHPWHGMHFPVSFQPKE